VRAAAEGGSYLYSTVAPLCFTRDAPTASPVATRAGAAKGWRRRSKKVHRAVASSSSSPT